MAPRLRARAWWLAAALALGVMPDAVFAASLQITPIRADLPAGPGAAALTLRNRGDTPIHAQVRVFRWQQRDGDDVLEPTSEAVASPPLVRIAAGGEQLVRIVRPGATAADGETTYRLLIDELPAAPGEADAPATTGVRVQLRYSVPVFAGTPANAPRPPLQFALAREHDAWVLSARNTGRMHAQISQVQLSAADGQAVTLAPGLLGYALRNSGRSWRLDSALSAQIQRLATRAPDRPGAMTVRAVVNGDPVQVPLDTGGDARRGGS